MVEGSVSSIIVSLGTKPQPRKFDTYDRADYTQGGISIVCTSMQEPRGL